MVPGGGRGAPRRPIAALASPGNGHLQTAWPGKGWRQRRGVAERCRPDHEAARPGSYDLSRNAPRHYVQFVGNITPPCVWVCTPNAQAQVDNKRSGTIINNVSMIYSSATLPPHGHDYLYFSSRKHILAVGRVYSLPLAVRSSAERTRPSVADHEPRESVTLPARPSSRGHRLPGCVALGATCSSV